jgi:hypothetical protein
MANETYGIPRGYFLRFLRNDLSINTSDWGRWLDQAKDAHAQTREAISSPPSAPINHTLGALRLTPPYFYGEGNLYAGGSCKSSPESESRVHLQPHHAQLRKKRNKSNKASL